MHEHADLPAALDQRLDEVEPMNPAAPVTRTRMQRLPEGRVDVRRVLRGHQRVQRQRQQPRRQALDERHLAAEPPAKLVNRWTGG